MKNLFLTFAFVLTATMVNAQQTVSFHKLVNGQWQFVSVNAVTMFDTPQGRMNASQYAATWETAYQNANTANTANTGATSSGSGSNSNAVVDLHNQQTLEMQRAQIDNVKADTSHKKTQTFLNIVSTGVNVLTTLKQDNRNDQILCATLYGNRNGNYSNNGYQNNGGSCGTNYQQYNYYNNPAMNANCNVAGSAWGVRTY